MLKEEAVIEEKGERRKSARILALVEEKKVKQKRKNSSAAISANTNKVSSINKDVGDKSKAVLAEQQQHHAVLLITKTETPPPPLPSPLPPLPPVKKGQKRKRLEDLVISSQQVPLPFFFHTCIPSNAGCFNWLVVHIIYEQLRNVTHTPFISAFCFSIFIDCMQDGEKPKLENTSSKNGEPVGLLTEM